MPGVKNLTGTWHKLKAGIIMYNEKLKQNRRASFFIFIYTPNLRSSSGVYFSFTHNSMKTFGKFQTFQKFYALL
jgi:hypothetical protein